MRRSLIFLNSIFVLVLLGLPTSVAAETSRTLDEITKDLSNPVSGIAHIANDVVFRTSQGDLPDAGDQTGLNYPFRPSLGFPLANGKSVLFRGTIPLVYEQAKYVADREYYDFWQVISNPIITYDWEAASGNKLLLPIGGGIAKTTRIGWIPVQFALDIQNFIVSPDAYGPKLLMTFRFTPVFANLFQK